MNALSLLEHSDPILLATFALLMAMSLASWYVIFLKILVLYMEYKHLRRYRSSSNSSDIYGGVGALLTKHKESRTSSQHSTAQKEVLSMRLAQELDSIRVRLNRGLTVLASVGSSAPFIGLFGTVWGIYKALAGFAAEGNASLTAVAGPMGEALLATAAGLFAAIPAVLAYNAFVRAHNVLIQRLRHIAERLSYEVSN